MTAKLTPQTRLLAVLGLVLVVAFGGMMVMRSGLLDSSTSEEAVVPRPSSPRATTARPAGQAAVKPATPAVKPVVVLPGVPTPVAGALQRSTVVVTAVVGGTADRSQLAEARAGARSVGAAFVTIDVRREPQAKALSRFAGKGSDANVLVVRRPGKVVNSFTAYVDRAIVAQAAVNAGAVAPKKATATKAAAAKAAKKRAAAGGK